MLFFCLCVAPPSCGRLSTEFIARVCCVHDGIDVCTRLPLRDGAQQPRVPACNAAAGGTRTNMLCQGIRDSKGQARRARARAFNMAFRGQRGVRWRKAWQRPVDKGGMRERTPRARAAPAARDSMCERGARRGKAWGGVTDGLQGGWGLIWDSSRL